MNKSIGALCLLSAAAVLAACNSNGNSVTVPPGTGTNCGGPPSSNQLEVLFPIPNSRNAPIALGNVYVSTKGQLPPSNLFNMFLTQSNGSQTFTGVFRGINASQVPSPHATPSYSNPVYYASAIAGPYGSGYTIGPDQTVTLLWNDGGTGCTPKVPVVTFRTRK
jgi:hypothetical protein